MISDVSAGFAPNSTTTDLLYRGALQLPLERGMKAKA